MQQARGHFNPCLFNTLLYLSGRTQSGAQAMEVFSPDHDTLLPLQIPLPENHHCCVFVYNELLVLHSNKYVVKFEAAQDGQLRQRSQVQTSGVNKWQNSQPVVDRTRGVVYLVQAGKCLQVQMETGARIASIH